MLLPKFDYHEPATVYDACSIMGELGKKAKPIAGGTDLLVNMKKKVMSPNHLVSLSRIDDLKRIDVTDNRIRIGACLTASDLAESKEVKENLGALGKGAISLGSPLIRNLATIAGNLVTARPAADLPPPLMVYGAKIVLKSAGGEREVLLENFFKGPGQTVIEPDEILTEIVIKIPPTHSGAGYFKLGVRKALEISLANIAAFISLDSPNGAISDAKIAMGSVAPTPIRAISAEKILLGEKPSESLLARAAEAAVDDGRPIDDFRASAEYKKAMVGVLTRRTLMEAMNEAKKNMG